jgi:flavin-dependent thymidylate synthase
LKIEFLELPENPIDVAVSSARTCYSAKGLIKPEDSKDWKRREKLVLDLFKSGHHTTLQHTHITMLISGMSRHLIWRLLHSHNFYSSEQVSQRYAKMKLENVYIPENANSERWQEFYTEKFDEYQQLSEILEKYFKENLPKFQRKSANKKAMEIARYVLPQGVTATLYHSVNILSILRYISVSKSLPEASTEAMRFGEILKSKLIEIDPVFKELIKLAEKENAVFPNNDIAKYRKLKKVFDVIGDLSFKLSENYSGVLRNSQMLHDSGMIGGLSTYSKISLSADAQNQRHRRSLAVRPKLVKDFEKISYYPPILNDIKDAKHIYKDSLSKTYNFFEKEKNIIGFSEAVYSLPNSHLIELVERSDWSSYQHKAQMRLCYNAQEEIWRETYEQIKILREKKVSGIEKLMPPCSIRFQQNKHPICPEGERYCGVKVWKKDFDELNR